MSGPSAESANEIPPTTVLAEESAPTNTQAHHDNDILTQPKAEVEAEEIPALTNASDNKEADFDSPLSEDVVKPTAADGLEVSDSSAAIVDSQSPAQKIQEQEDDKPEEPVIAQEPITEASEPAAPEEEVIEPKEVPQIDELESLKSKETEVADSARDISIPAAERAGETSETNSPDVEPQTSEEPVDTVSTESQSPAPEASILAQDTPEPVAVELSVEDEVAPPADSAKDQLEQPAEEEAPAELIAEDSAKATVEDNEPVEHAEELSQDEDKQVSQSVDTVLDTPSEVAEPEGAPATVDVVNPAATESATLSTAEPTESPVDGQPEEEDTISTSENTASADIQVDAAPEVPTLEKEVEDSAVPAEEETSEPTSEDVVELAVVEDEPSKNTPETVVPDVAEEIAHEEALVDEPSAEEVSTPIVQDAPEPTKEEKSVPSDEEVNVPIPEDSTVEATPELVNEDEVPTPVADEPTTETSDVPSVSSEVPNVTLPQSEDTAAPLSLIDEDAIASAIAESAEQIGLDSEAIKAADATDAAAALESEATPSNDEPVAVVDVPITEPTTTLSFESQSPESAPEEEAAVEEAIDETTAPAEPEVATLPEEPVAPLSEDASTTEVPAATSEDEPSEVDHAAEDTAEVPAETISQPVEEIQEEDVHAEEVAPKEEEPSNVSDSDAVVDVSSTQEEPSVVDEESPLNIGVTATEAPLAVASTDSEEVASSNVSVSEEKQSPIPSIIIPEAQDAEDQNETPSRPKSPWTPSYSVSVQGSPAQHPVVDSSDVPPISDLAADSEPVDVSASTEAPVLVADEVPAAVEAPEDVSNDSISVPAVEAERPKSPWTPSYSVSTQGAPTETEKDEAEPVTEPEAEPEIDNIPVEDPIASVNEAVLELSLPVIQTPEETPQEFQPTSASSVETEDVARPKSPWTPSYSISVQGTPIVEKDEALALSISEGGVDDATHDEVPAEGSSDIAPEVASAPIEPPQAVFQDTETTSLSALGEEAVERPKSPWTPSYSVSTQGTPVLETPEEASNIAEDKTINEPSILTEDPVSEETGLDITSTEEPERPKSPWAASYSVSTQGSPAPPVAPLPVEEEAPKQEPPTALVEDPSPSNVFVTVEDTDKELSLKTDVDEERPKSPWTPSYSVSVQGSPNIQPVQVIEAVDEVQPLDLNVAEDAPVAAEHSSPIPTIAIDSDEPAEAPVEVERPKSPWTPSYSVSVQGSPAKVEVPLPEEAPVEEIERPKSPWSPSYSVSRQGSPAPTIPADTPAPVVAPVATPVPQSEAPILNTLLNIGTEGVSRTISTSTNETVDSPADGIFSEPVSAVETTPSEAPRSPWTPSYSVSRQGSLLFDTGKSAAVVESTDDITVEDQTPNPEADGSHEPESIADKVKDALAFPTVTHVTEELDSPSIPRARLDSTTSSRFFPGGWFSSWKTVEGRASFDNAEGEFVSPAKTDSVPATVEEEGEASSATGPKPVAAAGEEKKPGRWCTIM